MVSRDQGQSIHVRCMCPSQGLVFSNSQYQMWNLTICPPYTLLFPMSPQLEVSLSWGCPIVRPPPWWGCSEILSAADRISYPTMSHCHLSSCGHWSLGWEGLLVSSQIRGAISCLVRSFPADKNLPLHQQEENVTVGNERRLHRSAPRRELIKCLANKAPSFTFCFPLSTNETCHFLSLSQYCFYWNLEGNESAPPEWADR